VELGALVVTQNRNTEQMESSAWPVLGRTVLDQWVERVETLGVGTLSVVDREASPAGRVQTMMDWAKGGVERILLILLGSYAEVDFADLIRFHQQGQNQVTRVFDSLGPLGVSLLDRQTILKNGLAGNQCAATKHSSRYDFLGYSVRLSSPGAYRTLVEDALEGRCGIQPNGLEAGDNVWIHPTAHIDPSVRLERSCYIGPYSRLNPGVVIGAGSSVEHNCDIDIGTTLERASLLPDTYLAPGLYVRNSVVDGTQLAHLDRGVLVDLGSLRLASRRKPIARYSPRTVTLGKGLDNACVTFPVAKRSANQTIYPN
jgi:acetyltransferase-like isoleucine patch superfamily enzyme